MISHVNDQSELGRPIRDVLVRVQAAVDVARCSIFPPASASPVSFVEVVKCPTELVTLRSS